MSRRRLLMPPSLLPPSLLLLLLTSAMCQPQPVAVFRRGGGVWRSSQPLALHAPGTAAASSALQCAAACSRQPECAVWSRDPDSGACSVFPAASGAAEDVQDDTSYQRLPAENTTSGEVVMSGMLYRLLTSRSLWEEGRAACQALGPDADLAVPSSNEVVRALSTLVTPYTACGGMASLGVRCTEDGDTEEPSGDKLTLQPNWFADSMIPPCKTTLVCYIIVANNYMEKTGCDVPRCPVCQMPVDYD